MNLSVASLKKLLLLNALPIASRRIVIEALNEGMDPAVIADQIRETNLGGYAEKYLEKEKNFDAAREMDRCAALGIGFIPITTENYPASLKNIYDPPLVLYVKGSMEVCDAHAVAVVGSRHPSFYGVEQARRFSRELADKGLTIISGLAKGIDQAAHSAAMEVRHGRTIAVLGSGLDVIYPASNGSLFEKITERGAVISEYPLGTPPLAHHFPARNRIISGLSNAVLVIEAHSRSGSLITAHEAAEQGKEVFAVPGPVNQLTSRGCHRLIKEGAHLAEDPEDVLQEVLPILAFQKTQHQPEFFEQATERQTAPAVPVKTAVTDDKESVILALIENGICDYETLVKHSAFSSSEMMVILTRLEMRRHIKKQPQGAFIINSMN